MGGSGRRGFPAHESVQSPSDLRKSPSSPQGTLNLPGRVLFGQVLSFIVCPFTAGKCELHLHFAVLEVQRKRDQRKALLRRLTDQPLDLPPVQQQLSGPSGQVVRPR